MRGAAGAIAALALSACAPSDPQTVADTLFASCETNINVLERVTACTLLLDNDAISPERRALALVNRGIVRGSLGQNSRAIADFGRALRLDPRNALAYLERGFIHQNRGAYDQAMRDYDMALALQPDLEAAAMRREEAMLGLSQAFLRDLEDYDRRLLASPRDADLLNGRCWLRAVNGSDLDLALADCDESLRLMPNRADVLDSRGLVRLKRGEFAAAEADYGAAFAATTNRGHYLYGRGLARIGLGRKVEGAADLIEGERLEPGVAALYRSYRAQQTVLTGTQAPARAP